MISQAKFHGGVFAGTAAFFSSPANALRSDVRVNYVFATSGATLKLPDARYFLQRGWCTKAIYNNGTFALVIQDAAGGTLVASLTTGQLAIFTLADNSTQAGTWIVQIRNKLT